MNIYVFCDATPCNVIEIYRLFGKVAAIINRRLPRSTGGRARECKSDYSPSSFTGLTRLIGGTRRQETKKQEGWRHWGKQRRDIQII